MSVVQPEGEKARLLIVDDNPNLAATLRLLLREDFAVEVTHDAETALGILEEFQPQVALLDQILPGMSGIAFMKLLREVSPQTVVVMLTIVDRAGPAVEALQAGAVQYLVKPFEEKKLRKTIQEALEEYRWRSVPCSRGAESDEPGCCGMVGRSPVMRRLYRGIRDVALLDTNVLIHGETGTGKELIAQAIHEIGPRFRGPFVPLNCSAIGSDLAESELFGHEKGAFTGAHSTHKGKFEQAHEGTLFLDEIGTMPLSVQAKLLRVLEDRVVYRIGSETGIRVNLRIIAATNIDLVRAVTEGRFREDLYYRLSAIRLKAPPLRERSDDIPLLARHFVQRHRWVAPHRGLTFSPSVMKILTSHSWRGNVRELENTILRLLCLRKKGRIEPEDLPSELLGSRSEKRLPGSARGADLNLLGQRERSERTVIQEALHRANGNRVEAARLLRIHESTLYRKMKKYCLK
ncbi:MAG: sigma-54-dependent transcriptional regulator [Planctomycetota bacterium]|jgi:two-component system NtrC family response regulator